MSIITRMRKQSAVYWPPTGADEYGHPTFGTAVAVSCRWEDKSEEFVDDKGERQVSNAVVYVDQDMVPGGWLWLGSLGDESDSGDPIASGAHEIRKFEKVPNLKATEHLRTVML